MNEIELLDVDTDEVIGTVSTSNRFQTDGAYLHGPDGEIRYVVEVENGRLRLVYFAPVSGAVNVLFETVF